MKEEVKSFIYKSRSKMKVVNEKVKAANKALNTLSLILDLILEGK